MGVDWTHLLQDRDQWWIVLMSYLTYGFHKMGGEVPVPKHEDTHTHKHCLCSYIRFMHFLKINTI